MIDFDANLVAKIEGSYADTIKHVRQLYDLGQQALVDGHAASETSMRRLLASFFLARSTTALRSVVNLFCLGAETDATSVFRTLVELAIDFEFIWKKDIADNVQRYLDFGHIVAHRQQLLLKKLYPTEDHEAGAREGFADVMAAYPDLGFNTYEEYKSWSDAQFARLAPKFTNAKGKLDRQWSRTPVSQRSELVDPLGVSYELFYAMGCDASHSGAGTIAELREPHLCVPRVPASDLLLSMAAWNYVFVLTKATHELGLPQETILTLATELGIPSAS